MSATYPAPAVRVQGETLALSATLASLGLYPAHHQLVLYNPAVDFRLHLNPALIGATFYDASATAGARFLKAGSTSGGSLASDLADRASPGTGTLLDAMQTTDYLYLCFANVIGGIRVVMTASVNATVSAMTGKYYDASADRTAGFWADLSVTDGSDSGSGATMDQTGSVTWTAPTDWVAVSLQDVLANDNTNRRYVATGVLLNDAGLVAGDTTLAVDTVDATTQFNVGDIIAMDSELMQATAIVSATEITVTRGHAGTTAASHDNNTELLRQRDPTASGNVPGTYGFWMRISVSVALGADVEIQDVWALNKDTSRAYFRAGVEYVFSLDRRSVGSFEAVLAANTDTLQVSHVRNVGV